jgi:hypothetical protein
MIAAALFAVAVHVTYLNSYLHIALPFLLLRLPESKMWHIMLFLAVTPLCSSGIIVIFTCHHALKQWWREGVVTGRQQKGNFKRWTAMTYLVLTLCVYSSAALHVLICSYQKGPRGGPVVSCTWVLQLKLPRVGHL